MEDQAGCTGPKQSVATPADPDPHPVPQPARTWMELVSACPMCSAPVTLGGGMTMTKGGLVEVGSGLKKPHCSHHSYLHVHHMQCGLPA